MARGRGSMRDRLERLRGEAAANEREREEKRKARDAAREAREARGEPTARSRAEATLPGSTRMKFVWAICDRRAEVVRQFPFPQKAEAEAELERINAEADLKHQHILQKRRVPMDA